MKTYLFYRSNTEDEVFIRQFLRDVEATGDANFEKQDINTREGDDKARLYDIVTYPSVLVVGNDGQLIRAWNGVLPLMSELGYYLHQD